MDSEYIKSVYTLLYLYTEKSSKSPEEDIAELAVKIKENLGVLQQQNNASNKDNAKYTFEVLRLFVMASKNFEKNFLYFLQAEEDQYNLKDGDAKSIYLQQLWNDKLAQDHMIYNSFPGLFDIDDDIRQEIILFYAKARISNKKKWQDIIPSSCFKQSNFFQIRYTQQLYDDSKALGTLLAHSLPDDVLLNLLLDDSQLKNPGPFQDFIKETFSGNKSDVDSAQLARMTALANKGS